VSNRIEDDILDAGLGLLDALVSEVELTMAERENVRGVVSAIMKIERQTLAGETVNPDVLRVVNIELNRWKVIGAVKAAIVFKKFLKKAEEIAKEMVSKYGKSIFETIVSGLVK
jgi:hypothetical protein